MRPLATREPKKQKPNKPKSRLYGGMIKHQRPELTDTPDGDGVVTRLITDVRVPIALVRVPRILRGSAARGT